MRTISTFSSSTGRRRYLGWFCNGGGSCRNWTGEANSDVGSRTSEAAGAKGGADEDAMEAGPRGGSRRRRGGGRGRGRGRRRRSGPRWNDEGVGRGERSRPAVG